MKVKFYIGIFIAIFLGAFFAQGMITGFSYASGFIDIDRSSDIQLGADDDTYIEISESEEFPEQEEVYYVEPTIIDIPKEGKVILADLEQMRLQTVEDGEVVEEYEILSKGRADTPWETPPGQYKIMYKTENHFSSIGGVWMPYSMQFFGNFFIHGWPYYPGGTPVAEGYSGGCVRMNNTDMEEIYSFSEQNTPILIRGSQVEKKNEIIESGRYDKFSKSYNLPRLSSSAFLVADLNTGEIIASNDRDVEYPIASLSKLMTALVSLETINQYKEAVVTRSAVGTYGKQGGLSYGERIAVGDLLYPLLLESSNDAAEVIAEHAGRNFFIENMNDKAESIGLYNTHFDDPSGLSAKNISTAEDLFKLTKYIHQYKNYIFSITKEKEYEIEGHTWFSNSKFRNDEMYRGGKNGYIDAAKHTLISTFDLPLEEFGKRRVAIIILQSDDATKDTRSVLLYLLENIFYSTD